MKTKRMIAIAASVLTFAALTGCSEKDAVSVEGSSDNSSYSSDASSNNSSAYSSGSVNSSTTSNENNTSSSSSSVSSSSAVTSSTSLINTESSAPTATSEPVVSSVVEENPPAAEQEWTERVFEAPVTFYVNQNNVKSRSKPVQGSTTVKTYNQNDKVITVAEAANDYFKLEDGSFIHTDYLSKTSIEVKDNNLKVGDKNSNGYTIIGITSDGTPYIGIDDNYEKKGTVIVDYISGRPIYTDDPEKKQEIQERHSGVNLDHITMGN